MPNINKNIIKQAGAAVANATNEAAGLSASTPEPGTVISAIQLINGGRKIGPADVVHFTESVRNKLLSLLVSIEPTQDLHGYDSPWPAGGGVNLLPADYTESITGTKVFIFDTPLPAGQYTFSFISADTSSQVDSYQLGLYRDGTGNYVYTAVNPTQGFATFTNREPCSKIVLYSNKAYNQSAGFTTVFTGLMFKAGGRGAYSPYSNICPISGRTGENAYVSPTPNVADATTYAADWTTPAGTVYAGSADIVTGNIKAAPYYASYNGETLVGPWVSSMDVYDPDGTPTTGAQVVDLGGTMTDYHITGQDIITLVGDNYIWSDSGDVTITE